VVGELEQEYPQADFYFQHFTQRPDWAVADSEPVAFFSGEVLPRLPRVEVTDAAGGLEAAGWFAVGAPQEVKVVIGPLLELRYNLGHGLSVRCVGKGCPEASSDGEWRGRRPQEFADRLAVYLREPDEFLRANLTSPLFDRNQQWSAHAQLG
jgi:hypothetical protein